MQTKFGSIVETSTNIVIGFVISLLLNAWILPLMGHQVTPSQNVIIVMVFTIASFIRSYLLRRLFNRISVFFN